MKMDCPVCNQAITGDTELAVTLAMMEHAQTSGEDHREKLAAFIELLERHIAFADRYTAGSHDTRAAIYDKATKADVRLRMLQIYGKSIMELLMRAARDIYIDAAQDGSVLDHNAGKNLFRNFRDALTSIECRYRR